MAQIPQTAMDPMPVGLTQAEVLGKLGSFLKERNPVVPGATQQGIMDLIEAIKRGLFGPQTYGPLDDITMVAHQDPKFRQLGEMMPRYEHLRDFKPLTTSTETLNRAKWEYDNGLWPVAQSKYDSGELVPWGILPQSEPSVIMLSNRGRNPVPEVLGRQLRTTPGHEFTHAAHLYGDEESFVKGLYDRITKMPPEKIRETAFGLSSEMFPESHHANKLLTMYQSRQNPNELIAGMGGRDLADIIRRR
jgi:hypothetical protein